MERRRQRRRARRAEEEAAASRERVAELEEKMTLLQWRKQETETRMRDMLEGTRSMQEEDRGTEEAKQRQAMEDTAQWMQDVIRDELERPLTVTEDDLRSFDRADARVREETRARARRQQALIRATRKRVKDRIARAGTGVSDKPRVPGQASDKEVLDRLAELQKVVRGNRKRAGLVSTRELMRTFTGDTRRRSPAPSAST